MCFRTGRRAAPAGPRGKICACRGVSLGHKHGFLVFEKGQTKAGGARRLQCERHVGVLRSGVAVVGHKHAASWRPPGRRPLQAVVPGSLTPPRRPAHPRRRRVARRRRGFSWPGPDNRSGRGSRSRGAAAADSGGYSPAAGPARKSNVRPRHRFVSSSIGDVSTQNRTPA